MREPSGPTRRRELLGHTTAKKNDGSHLQWAPLDEMPVHDPQTAA